MPRPVREIQRQPRPVERGDRTGEDADQEQPEHLADSTAAARGVIAGAGGGCRAGRLDRDRRHPLLVGEDREPRQQPQQAEQRRDRRTPCASRSCCARKTTMGGAMTEPNCAPALKTPPARDRRRGREQAGERLDAGGVVAALAQAHQEAQQDEAGESGSERRHAGQPADQPCAIASTACRVRRARAASQITDQATKMSASPTRVPTRSMSEPGRNLPDHHAEVEGDGDVAVLRVAPLELPSRSSDASTESTCRSSRLIVIDADSSPTIVHRV